MRASQQRAMAEGLSKQQRLHAERTRCPKCARKQAVVRWSDVDDPSIVRMGSYCRWDDCDYTTENTVDRRAL